MQNSVWKLTALAGVVGIGFLVVLQAQRGLSRPEGQAENQAVPKSDLGEGQSTPPPLENAGAEATADTAPPISADSAPDAVPPAADSGEDAPDPFAGLETGAGSEQNGPFSPETRPEIDEGSGSEPPRNRAAGESFAGGPLPPEAGAPGAEADDIPSDEMPAEFPPFGGSTGGNPDRFTADSDRDSGDATDELVERGPSPGDNRPPEESPAEAEESEFLLAETETVPAEPEAGPPAGNPFDPPVTAEERDSASASDQPSERAATDDPADDPGNATSEESPAEAMEAFDPFAEPGGGEADAPDGTPAPEPAVPPESEQEPDGPDAAASTTTKSPPAGTPEPDPAAFDAAPENSSQAESGSDVLPAEAPAEETLPAEMRSDEEAEQPFPSENRALTAPDDRADQQDPSSVAGPQRSPRETSERAAVEILAAPDKTTESDPLQPETEQPADESPPGAFPPQPESHAREGTNGPRPMAEPAPATAATDEPPQLPAAPENAGAPQRLEPPSEAAALDAARTGDLQGDGTVAASIPRGPQQPQLTIQKLAPQYAVLGQPMTYSVVVRNVGRSPAAQIVVEDRIPKGAKLVSTEPQAEVEETRLVWRIESLPPGEKRQLDVRVVPTAEGEIGSVATVSFSTAVAAETQITAPKLAFSLTGPENARVGEPVRFHFQIRNDGTGPAQGVMIRDLIPKGLHHPQGDDLEYEIGTLAAGESRQVTLSLTAEKAGRAVNRAVATADGGVEVEAEAAVDVTAESLEISRSGPNAVYVGRAAEFTNTVTNRAGRPLSGVTVSERVPDGMEFVEATAGGRYQAAKRIVSWRIGELGPRQSVDVKVTLRPTQPGTHRSTVEAAGPRGQSAETAAETQARGFTAVGLEIAGVEGPLSVGETATVRIVANNRGTSAASRVQLNVDLPKEAELVSVDAPVPHSVRNGTVRFEPIRSLPGRQQSEFRIVLKAGEAGDVRLRADIRADHMQKPLSQEEALVVLPALR